jgi:hypothetical protein
MPIFYCLLRFQNKRQCHLNTEKRKRYSTVENTFGEYMYRERNVPVFTKGNVVVSAVFIQSFQIPIERLISCGPVMIQQVVYPVNIENTCYIHY